MTELRAMCKAKDNEISKLEDQLQHDLKASDFTATRKTSVDVDFDESTSLQDMQDVDVDAEDVTRSKNENENLAVDALSAKVAELEGLVGEVKKERDNAIAALASMKESSRLLRQEFEESKVESEGIVGQWTGRKYIFMARLSYDVMVLNMVRF